jgi:ecotropic viral integration site 5 protein
MSFIDIYSPSYDTEVGYCQGLPFVVAVLLLNVSHSDRTMDFCLILIKMPDEEAFCLLVRFMYVYDLRGHFLPEMPKLQLRLVPFFSSCQSVYSVRITVPIRPSP